MVYLAKPLPSDSGIALYSALFSEALSSLGDVRVVRAPRNAADSQGLLATIRTTAALVRVTRRLGPDLVHVELAGRCLAEFYSALAVSALVRRTTLSVTVHDAPAVTGAAFLFRFADRRGFRRIPMWASRRWGQRVEKWLLRRAEVFTLSDRGARSLSDAFAVRKPVTLPHVVPAPLLDADQPHGRHIFLPGYIRSGVLAADFLKVALAAEALRGWTFSIGDGDAETMRLLRGEVRRLNAEERVRFLGHQEHLGFLAAFSVATVTVRLGGDGGRVTDAVSGPAVYAMAAGSVLITDDGRGIRDYLEDGGNAIVVSTAAQGVSRLTSLVRTKTLGDIGLSARRTAARWTPPNISPRIAQATGLAQA